MSNISEAEFERRLSASWPLLAEPAEAFEACYLDSFDWRLYHAGLMLLAQRVGSGWRLQLAQIKSAELQLEADNPEQPGLLDSLVHAELRERLAPVLEMRCLLPQLWLGGRNRQMRLLDDEEKTLVRIELLEIKIRPSDGAGEGAGDGDWLETAPIL
ncbi:MAG: hypothetical protein HQL47_00550, partial [Gammaproteobacteria bacterium]|nr:hypothetical protein [Gammaproteobacteria bacterium]